MVGCIKSIVFQKTFVKVIIMLIITYDEMKCKNNRQKSIKNNHLILYDLHLSLYF